MIEVRRGGTYHPRPMHHNHGKKGFDEFVDYLTEPKFCLDAAKMSPSSTVVTMRHKPFIECHTVDSSSHTVSLYTKAVEDLFTHRGSMQWQRCVYGVCLTQDMRSRFDAYTFSYAIGHVHSVMEHGKWCNARKWCNTAHTFTLVGFLVNHVTSSTLSHTLVGCLSGWAISVYKLFDIPRTHNTVSISR